MLVALWALWYNQQQIEATEVNKDQEDKSMVEVVIDSIRVSLVSQHRLIILKDMNQERYLPIWIGPCEAEAITIELQEVEVARPLTHDLLKTCITELGGTVSHVLINDLRNDTFYATIFVDVDGRQVEIDSRPSDSIALAVRVRVPVYVEESVMDQASIYPEESQEPGEESEDLSVFRDFVDTLDMDNMDSD